MRLLIELGYEKFLLREGANVAAVLEALAEPTPVEENRTDFSKPAQYVLKRGGSGFTAPVFVLASQLIDEDEAAEMDIDALKKENARLHKERAEAKAKLKTLEEKVEGLTVTESQP